MQPSQPDMSITTTTGGYHSSRVMGNKGQAGGERGEHTITALKHELFTDYDISAMESESD